MNVTKSYMNTLDINNKIITIDGPSASGKGTVAKKLANLLNYKYLDSGALYRLVAYIHYLHKFNLQNNEIIVTLEFIFSNCIEFTQNDILLNNQSIENELRSEKIGNLASKLATSDLVRNKLLNWQQSFATSQGLVTDGRDMGSIIFPQAKYKIFLIADVQKRAMRRFLQLTQQNLPANYKNILQDLIIRDKRDIERANAPLKPTLDAHIIDNSELSIEETINLIMQILKN